MENTSENFYRSLYSECEETSKMFRFIPIFFTEKKSSSLFYLFLILLTCSIGIIFNIYSIYLITILIIAEHRRIVLVRETVLDMCITEEVFYNMERRENSDVLNKLDIDYELSDGERCEFFYERLNYVDCVNPYIYIKRHYQFLLTIVALLGLFTFLFVY